MPGETRQNKQVKSATYHTTTTLSVAAAVLLCAVVLPAPSALAWWSAPHGDFTQSGRVQGSGQITSPGVAWEQDTGGQLPDRATLIADVNGDGQTDYLVVVGGAVVARRLDQTLLWDTPSLGLTELVAAEDFNGDGRPEVLALGRIAVLLDGANGQALWRHEGLDGVILRSLAARLVQADDDPTPEVLLVVGQPTSLSLHDFGQGFEAPLRWSTEDPALPGNVFRPVVGDLDGDGLAMEVGVINQENCKALVLALDSGQVRAASEGLTRGRFCYGLAQAANVDDDPQQELIFTGAVGQSGGSVGVTVFDARLNQIQWQHEYAENAPAPTTFSPSGAVADLDGDGRMELVTSVFDNRAEVGGQDDGVDLPGAWTVVIYDAATGQTLGSVPDRVAVGMADLSAERPGDELIIRQSVPGSVRVPDFGAVELLGLDRQRRPAALWRLEDTRVVQQAARDPSINSRDNGNLPALWRPEADAPAALLTLRRQGEQALFLEAVRLGDPGQLTTLASAALQAGEEVSLLATPGQRVALKNNLGRIALRGAGLALDGTLAFTGHATTPRVLPIDAEGTVAVVYRDSAGNLVAVSPGQATRADGAPELWRRPGGRRAGGFVTADLDGDGAHEIIQSGEEDDGTPWLEVLDGQGQRRWRRLFEDGAGAPFSLLADALGPGGRRTIAALRFTLDGRALAETFAPDDGRTLASHEAIIGEVGRFPNRALLPIDDRDGDGGRELALLHYTTLERLSGASLERVGEVVAFPQGTTRPANSALIPGPQGQERVFLNLFSPRKALLDLEDGAVVWAVDADPSVNAGETPYAGLSDGNGDGHLDVAIPGRLGDLTLLDGATGAPLWRRCLVGGRSAPLEALATPETCSATTTVSSVLAADIDGDGQEELLLGTSDGWLHALAADTGESRWSVFLEISVQQAALADLDGDGALEVLAVTADSRVVAIDEAALDPVAEVRDVLLDAEDQIVAPEVDLDTTSRLDALGVVWEPVQGADGYLVTLLSENLNEVTPEIAVRGTTQATFTGLSLIVGTTYVARVTPFSDRAGAASPTTSDGILVTGAGIDIVGFEITPDPFDPLRDPPAALQATVASSAGVAHVTLTLQSIDEQGPGQVLERRLEARGADRFEIDEVWDGRDGFGVVPPGLYLARLIAFDLDGAGVADIETVEVRYEPLDDEPDAGVPDVGDERTVVIAAPGGDCCGCALLGVRPPLAPGALALVLLGLLVVSRDRRRRRPEGPPRP